MQAAMMYLAILQGYVATFMNKHPVLSCAGAEIFVNYIGAQF